MIQTSSLMNFSNKRLLKALIVIQLIVIIGIYLNVRTEFTWFWAIFSFIPPVIVCLNSDEKRYVVSSLILLFVSQHAFFIFTNPPWGYSVVHLHDSINDLHIASIISENAHFELGQVGYGAQSFSYYPLMHLFSVALSKISGIPLVYIARYIIPVFNATFTALMLYFLNSDLFKLSGQTRNVATLLFGTSWFYTFFQSQFAREVFAFPFVLLSLWIIIRSIKSSNHMYAVILPILYATVILSHHISAYMLLVIFSLIVASLNVFSRKNRMNNYFFLFAIALCAYISFVTVTLFMQQTHSIYETFLLLFEEGKNFSIMTPYAPWRTYLAFVYYAIIGLFVFIGGIRLIYEKEKEKALLAPEMLLIAFFVLSFLFCTVVRMSVSASPLSWAYDMALRGTIWAFIGISVVMAIGFKYLLKSSNGSHLKNIFAISLIICILSAGKFAQYPLAISDSTVAPYISYQRYISTLWLKNEATWGSNLLVVSFSSDSGAFEISRNMAPYAYLKGYFLDYSKGFTYEKFNGYIPFIGSSFDQYKDMPNVQVIYSNGDSVIGYKK